MCDLYAQRTVEKELSDTSGAATVRVCVKSVREGIQSVRVCEECEGGYTKCEGV